ncbi:tryptophan halogenase family protein [Nitrospirillum sp. BR 11752]|uniref:tryptophan halogenase family protein n=1 Tax=Nitrospirillum sp. BR 11752 TaxID=3104293 RepID=UPI002E9E8DFE|nr:tryptophan halogenase family protein [Nitrospirillum sp. BR 11752]
MREAMAQAPSGKSENHAIRRVVVVGGGSAGWIAAARIAARNADPEGEPGHDRVAVVLVESPTEPSIGVGEGTWPTMRNTLAKIRLSETDFIRSADAVFKQGARFVGWTWGGDDAYYHPLNPPVGAGEVNLSPHWQERAAAGPAGEDFAHSVDFQGALCDAGLAPKAITHPEYAGLANYAYHLDAGKFATLLRDHAVGRLGVRHVVGDVVAADQTAEGDIQALRLADGTVIEGDLFVDCTGFKGVLIDRVYGVPLKSCRQYLFADKALALQIPYPVEDAPIACHTVSTAQTAGWIWDIGLWSRRGIGYVYSSAHTSADQAEATLRAYAGPGADALSVRSININAGHRETFWINNCVAVGLSAGFIEPLEASALMLIELSMDTIADRLPATRRAMDHIARQFNADFHHHWARVIEFLKLHYVLTHRPEPFWQDNLDPASFPDGLGERLELWRHHPPCAADFTRHREVFSWPSYQYVLHGMGFPTQYAGHPTLGPERKAAARLFARAAAQRSDAMTRLPPHRSLIRAIRQHGLQRL